MSVVKDKATAFKNEISGSHTNKIVCKASSHEVAGPKKKHVDYLLHMTNNPNFQNTTLCDLITDRLKNNNWVVVFKALILCHNLMSLGNVKFMQCAATRTHMFDMDAFIDKSDVLASDMSSYVRKYGRYVRVLCIGYKALALDVCKIPTRGDDNPFGTMEVSKLLKTTAVIQDQLDLLLEVEFASSELSNGVINTAFLMLYKDLVKLYTVYNDALIQLLEKFFEMKKSDCKETIKSYRKFLLRQEAIQRYLKLAENVGVDKDAHFNLRQVPEDLLPALEGHITDLDAAKKASGAQPSPQIQAASERLQQLREKDLRKSTSPNQSGSGVVSGFPSASQEVLDLQRKRFEELKKRASEGQSSSFPPAKSTATDETSTTVITIPAPAPAPKSSALDLFGLENNTSPAAPAPTFDPWTSNPATNSTITVPQSTITVPQTSSNPFQTPSSSLFSPSGGSVSTTTSDPWGTGSQQQPSSNTISSYQEVDLFNEIRGGGGGGGNPNFDNVFGSSSGTGNNPPMAGRSAAAGVSYSLIGDMLTPLAVGAHAQVSQEQQLGGMMNSRHQTGLAQDVDSSLALAASNLGVNMGGGSKTGLSKKTEHQWTAPKESVITGGPNWQRQNLQPKTLTPSESKLAANWSGGMQAGHFPLNNTMQQQQQQQPMMSGAGFQPRMTMGPQPPMMMGGGMQQQSGVMMSGAGVGGYYQQQPMMMGQPVMQPGGMWPQQQQQQQQNPFGQNAPLF